MKIDRSEWCCRVGDYRQERRMRPMLGFKISLWTHLFGRRRTNAHDRQRADEVCSGNRSVHRWQILLIGNI